MVKGHGIDDHKLGEVILVGVVVAVPGYHIKGGVALKIERQAKLHAYRDVRRTTTLPVWQ